jgi:anti-anti-sigma factor
MAALDPDPDTVVETRDGEVPTLVLRGELDSSNVALLQRAVDAVLAKRPTSLVFDFTKLTFIDSAGIAVLVTTRAVVKQIEIRNPSAILRRVLTATGLTDLLHLEP